MHGGQTVCWSRGGQEKPPGPGGETTARRLWRSPVPSLQGGLKIHLLQNDDDGQIHLHPIHEDQGPTAQSCEQRTAHSRSCQSLSISSLWRNNHQRNWFVSSMTVTIKLKTPLQPSSTPGPSSCGRLHMFEQTPPQANQLQKIINGLPLVEVASICNDGRWSAPLARRETPCKRYSWWWRC